MNTHGKIIATIEARMTSSRLPGKVLLPVIGKPLLEHMILRVKNINRLDDIVVATTTNIEDDPIVQLAINNNIHYFRGSENDVLKRVLEAGKKFNADILVQLTGDCPLIDSNIVELCIEKFLKTDADYVSSFLYPGGMDVSVFSINTLEEVEKTTKFDKAAREHVTLPIYENPKKYKLYNVKAPKKYRKNNINIEIDEPADYELIKIIFNKLYAESKIFTLDDILSIFEKEPELIEINSKVKRKSAR